MTSKKPKSNWRPNRSSSGLKSRNWKPGPVEDKMKSLTEALAQETKRREAVEKMAVEAFKRRRESEAQLAKNQEAEKTLRQAMEAPEAGNERGELEAKLAENKQAQARA